MPNTVEVGAAEIITVVKAQKVGRRCIVLGEELVLVALVVVMVVSAARITLIPLVAAEPQAVPQAATVAERVTEGMVAIMRTVVTVVEVGHIRLYSGHSLAG